MSWALPAFMGLALPVQAQDHHPVQGLLISQQSRTAFAIQGAGARAEGIGGAFTAVADDATAVSFNPAGLGQLLQPEFSLVGAFSRKQFHNHGFVSTDQNAPLDLSDTEARSHHLAPSFASVSLPGKLLGKNLVFQVSWQRMCELGLDSDNSLVESGATGQYPTKYLRQVIRQTGQVDVWSTAVAYDFSPRILVGVSFNFWRGAWDFHSTSEESLAPLPNAEVEDARIQENARLRGFNWNLGVLWRSEYLNVGAVYRSAFTARFDTRMTAQSNIPDSQLAPEFNASYSLRWPETFGAGVAFRPHQQWLFALDWTHTKWSEAAFMPKGGVLDEMNFFDLKTNTQTPDVETIRFGMEHLIFAGKSVVPLRVGVFQEPQPTSDPISGEQRVLRGFTVGLGWKLRSLGLDLAYKYSHGSRRASQFLEADEIASGHNIPTSRGQEVIQEQRLFFSLNYRFSNDRANRLLRWIFVQGN
jgi:long-subunit fatty acid transport protein